MSKSNVIYLNERPGPEHMRRYAESQAYRLLLSRRIPAHQRSATAAFAPSARTNLV